MSSIVPLAYFVRAHMFGPLFLFIVDGVNDVIVFGKKNNQTIHRLLRPTMRRLVLLKFQSLWWL
jgi:hypothetical protein